MSTLSNKNNKPLLPKKIKEVNRKRKTNLKKVVNLFLNKRDWYIVIKKRSKDVVYGNLSYKVAKKLVTKEGGRLLIEVPLRKITLETIIKKIKRGEDSLVRLKKNGILT